MNTTITRTVRAETVDHVPLDIPPSAWAEIQEVANEEFNTFLDIHFHKDFISYHHGQVDPFPHFFIEASVDCGFVNEFCERIDPMIIKIENRYTQRVRSRTK